MIVLFLVESNAQEYLEVYGPKKVISYFIIGILTYRRWGVDASRIVGPKMGRIGHVYNLTDFSTLSSYSMVSDS